MALSLAARCMSQRCLLRQAYPISATAKNVFFQPMATVADRPGESYWDKNSRLKRPISPHMTIYQPQLTWLMSLTHRTTGLMLAGMTTSFSVGMLMLPGAYTYYIHFLQNVHYGTACIMAAKFCLAFPLVFHTFSGIRHLMWDLGKGFELKTLYLSGYTVIGVSLLVSLLLAAR